MKTASKSEPTAAWLDTCVADGMRSRSCRFWTSPLLHRAQRLLRAQDGNAAAEYALLLAAAGGAISLAAFRLSEAVAGSMDANAAAVAVAEASAGPEKPLASAAGTPTRSVPAGPRDPDPDQDPARAGTRDENAPYSTPDPAKG